MKRFLSLLLISSFSFSVFAKTDSAVSQIDSYAARLRTEWGIPGFGLTVMYGDEIVLSRGYGVKTAGCADPVDGNTVFQIGSVSKSFTATLMAMMVDEGLVKWDDRVKDILHDFELKDKYVENEVRISDIMTHRMGFRSQAMTYVPNVGYNKDDVYRMMSLLEPSYPFRDGMHYNNMTFILAQKIIEKVSGLSWEENLEKRIFSPLGMTTACCGGEGFLAARNVASQHSTYRSKGVVRSSILKGDGRALHWLTVVGPAGGISCSSADLAKWARFHLSGVSADGHTLVSEGQMGYLHSGVAISTQNDEKITLYGQGWYIEQNKGYRVYYHTGTTWGHAALCVFVPELDLSFAMLFNSAVSSRARFALMRRIIDIYRGAPFRDHLKEARNASGGGSSYQSCFTYKYSSTVHPASALCGHYSKEDPFGDAVISLSNGKLFITIGKFGWKHPLGHTKGNMYFFHSDGHRFSVRVSFGRDGKARGFELDWGCGERFGPWKKKI